MDTRQQTMVVRRQVTVVTADGIHARPAMLLSRLASTFRCQVYLLRNQDRFDCKSILDILTAAATNGTQLEIEADGEDAQQAVEALAQLIESNFPAASDDDTKRNEPLR